MALPHGSSPSTTITLWGKYAKGDNDSLQSMISVSIFPLFFFSADQAHGAGFVILIPSRVGVPLVYRGWKLELLLFYGVSF